MPMVGPAIPGPVYTSKWLLERGSLNKTKKEHGSQWSEHCTTLSTDPAHSWVEKACRVPDKDIAEEPARLQKPLSKLTIHSNTMCF